MYIQSTCTSLTKYTIVNGRTVIVCKLNNVKYCTSISTCILCTCISYNNYTCTILNKMKAVSTYTCTCLHGACTYMYKYIGLVLCECIIYMYSSNTCTYRSMYMYTWYARTCTDTCTCRTNWTCTCIHVHLISVPLTHTCTFISTCNYYNSNVIFRIHCNYVQQKT